MAFYTMGDIARLSLSDASLLYDWFGINAELLIDHAWGWESCRMSDIQAIYPQSLQPRHKSGPAQALFTGKCPPDCMGDDG